MQLGCWYRLTPNLIFAIITFIIISVQEVACISKNMQNIFNKVLSLYIKVCILCTTSQLIPVDPIVALSSYQLIRGLHFFKNFSNSVIKFNLNFFTSFLKFSRDLCKILFKLCPYFKKMFRIFTTLLLGCFRSGTTFRDAFSISVALSLSVVLQLSNITREEVRRGWWEGTQGGNQGYYKE